MLFNFNGAKSWPWVADAKKVADATKSLPLLVEFNVAGQLGRGQAAKWPDSGRYVDIDKQISRNSLPKDTNLEPWSRAKEVACCAVSLRIVVSLELATTLFDFSFYKTLNLLA